MKLQKTREMMAISIEETTILTPEDELAAQILIQLSRDYRQQSGEEDASAEAEVPSTLLLQQVSEAPRNKKPSKRLKCNEKQPNKKKRVEEDDSEETLMLMHEWNQTELDPGEAVKIQPQTRRVAEEDDSDETLREILRWKRAIPEKPSFLSEHAVGVCSQPTWKQLMESDVKEGQCRLMLGKAQVKKMILQVMGDREKVGTNDLEVPVYGRGGEVHKMIFRMWSEDTPVLKSPGWKTFVRDNELKMHCDFLTLWMFKHIETGKICFAIDFTTLPVEKKLSWKITKLVNQN